jgi:hypothetical protein
MLGSDRDAGRFDLALYRFLESGDFRPDVDDDLAMCHTTPLRDCTLKQVVFSCARMAEAFVLFWSGFEDPAGRAPWEDWRSAIGAATAH